MFIINEGSKAIKSSKQKKYNSPYGEFRGTKNEIISYIDEYQSDMIPEGYSSARVVFNHIYKKDHGRCIICGDDTKWNETRGIYNRLCDKKSCNEEYVARFRKNMINVHGKTTLLNDMNHQKVMLANRSISGKYKFKDGGVKTYTGSYEKKALEFMDKILDINSKDLITPGPVFEYMYEGEVHNFITDMYYIPYNLLFDVKDGGGNRNTHPGLRINKEKQIAKEEAIRKANKYNYIRLTDNNFGQLLHIFADLKMNLMNNNDKPILHINENVRSKESNDKYVVLIGESGLFLNRVYLKDISILEGITADEFIILKVIDVPINIEEMTNEELIYDARFEQVFMEDITASSKEIVENNTISVKSLIDDTKASLGEFVTKKDLIMMESYIEESIKSKHIYYGLTEDDIKSKSIDYVKNNKYDGKGVNLSLIGLIKFLTDNNMQNDIKYYIKLDLDNFKVVENILYDKEYDMITIETPFKFDIDSYDEIDYSMNESYIEESKAAIKIPLTAKEREEVRERFGKIQCSIFKNKDGEFYATTHRARSKAYPSISTLPKDKVKFISSTS